MFPQTENIVGPTVSENVMVGTKTYKFDFNKGDFEVLDGKLVECDGVEAIKVWIEKILRTEKWRYSIYDGTEYGCHLEDLVIGNNYTMEFVEAELKREIEEALLQNPQITMVGGFELTRNLNSITVTLEVTLNDTGTSSITVTVPSQ